MADGKVIIDTSLNNKGFVKGINGMTGQVGGLTAAVKKLGMAIGVAFGVKAMVDFGKKAVELGSNVAEVQNVVDVAFGDMAYKIEDFAKTSIQNFGMSQLSAKKTASTYMAMARGMGINEQTASDMAIALTGLTGDVASFYNISQELADVKLKSVFTGETETLKDLGVVMTQANLKAYALSHGLSGNIEAMSQAQLVALRYNFVLDQLALANGDFARTADSWANQTHILSMQWQEFMSIMGQALIQVLTPVVRVLNSIVSALISMANTLNSVVSGLFGGANTQIQQTAANAEAVGGAIKGSVDQQDALTDATKETAKAQKKMLAGFDEINKLYDGGSGSSGGAGMGGGGALALPTQNVTVETTMGEGNAKVLEFFQNLQAAIEPTVDALGRLWEVLKMVGGFAGDALTDFYNTFLVPVGSWVMGEGLPRFIDAMTNGLAAVDWQKINNALHDLWEALAPFAVNVGEGLLWLWENVLVPFGTWTTNNLVPIFIEAVSMALDAFNNIWEAVKPGLEWLWDNFLQPIAAWTGGIIVSVLESIVDVLKKFSDWCGEHQTTIEDIALAVVSFVTAWEVVNVASKIGGIVKALYDFVTSGGLATAASGALSTALSFLAANPIVLVATAIAALVTGIVLLIKHWDDVKAAGSAAWEYIKATWDGVAEWFTKNIIAPVTSGFKRFINGLIGMVENFVNFFIRGINGIIGGFNKLSIKIPDNPITGKVNIGFNIPTVPPLKLPRLAQGAVIPPNREFMAVLGDQRHGNNIEAPESLLRKIVREEGGGMNAKLLQAILDAIREGKVLMVGKKQLGEVVSEALANRARARGAAAIPVV